MQEALRFELVGQERSRLVRLCGALTGDQDAAEDLAQETLLEAIRCRHLLRRTEAQSEWLTGIARNVCMRWRQRKAQERNRLPRVEAQGWPASQSLDEAVQDDFGVEVELERRELVELLDRALAFLPPGTREVLTCRYVDESAHAAIAQRFGISEAAVWMRIHRGKRLLQQVLTTELREDALSYGLVGPEDGIWQLTRIWCPLCGQSRLHGRFDHAQPALTMRCADCYQRWAGEIATTEWAACLNAVKGYRAALSRLNRMAAEQFRSALARGDAICQRCNHVAQVHVGRPASVPAPMRSLPGAYITCGHCGAITETTLDALVVALPAGKLFHKEHPRMRILPIREVEMMGLPALVSRFESVTGSASLEVVSARDTLEVLAVDPSPSAPVSV